jgi:hypothetical protein
VRTLHPGHATNVRPAIVRSTIADTTRVIRHGHGRCPGRTVRRDRCPAAGG